VTAGLTLATYKYFAIKVTPRFTKMVIIATMGFAGVILINFIASLFGFNSGIGGFGVMGLVTGPLWGRKAWGVWWQWDAKLTMALLLEMIFLGYQLVRRYGGPGSDKMSAALAVFGMVNVPFVYWSVNIWRTVHPKTSVVPTLGPGMFGAFWFSVLSFMLLFSLLMTLRLRLERQRAVLDELYLAEEP